MVDLQLMGNFQTHHLTLGCLRTHAISALGMNLYVSDNKYIYAKVNAKNAKSLDLSAHQKATDKHILQVFTSCAFGHTNP